MISGREVSAGVRKGGIRTFFAHPTLCIGGTRGARRGQTARSRCLPGVDSAVVVPVGGRAAQVGARWDRRRGRGASRGPGGSDWCPPGVNGTVAVFVGAGQVRPALFGGRYGRGVRWGSGGSGRSSSGIDGAAAASAWGGCMCFSALSVGVILLHTSFLGCSIYGTLLLSSP